MTAQHSTQTLPAAAASTGSRTEADDLAIAGAMRRQRWQDFLFHKITLGFALFVLLVLLGILVSLLLGALPAFKEFGWAFITTVEWDPVNDQYGALIAIAGTLATSLIALLIAFPLSFGIALFLTEICPAWLKRPLGTAVELLAGVPSIIYGMWGLFIFAPLFAEYVQPALKATLGQLPVIGALFNGPMMGMGILAAGLILAVMIIPFISSVMRDVFEIVPQVLKESAYGLGCTKWEVVRRWAWAARWARPWRLLSSSAMRTSCPGRCSHPVTVSPRRSPMNLPKPNRCCTCRRCTRSA